MYFVYSTHFFSNQDREDVIYIFKIAMQVTCRVVEDQNLIRKNFMGICRESELRNMASDLFLDSLLVILFDTFFGILY